MTRLLSLIAAAGLCACIDKPPRPSERPDGSPVDGDGGIDGDGASCQNPPDERTPWDADDVVRFEQTTANLNEDCYDDVIVPGETDDATHGVFIILGRNTTDFFVGGYDHFIATSDSQPLKAAAAELVGTPALDLVVFARSTALPTEDEAEVLVFEGVGDGSFLTGGISLRISASNIARTTPDEPAPMTLETVSAVAGDPLELVFGDSGSAWVIAPSAWTQGGLDTAAVEPFGDPETQGMIVAPSGRAGENDVVQIDTAEWKWFTSSTDSSYEPGSLNVMIDSGQRKLRRPDSESTTDIVSVSAQDERLTFLFITPPRDVDLSGVITVKPFIEEALGASDGILEAVEMMNLGGGGAPELVALDSGAATAPAVLWLFHDVDDTGDMVEPAGEEDPVEAAPFDDSHPYNRMVLGRFRNPGEIKIYLFSSSPDATPPICWLPAPDSGDLSRCN